MYITQKALEFRPSVYVLIFIILLMGADSYMKLPIEGAPEVEIPAVITSTVYPGVAPEDIEQLVTTPLEKQLKKLKNVDYMMSFNSESVSMIVVVFETDMNMDLAYQNVRDEVDQIKGTLPDDCEEPNVVELNTNDFPIVLVNLAGGGDLVALKSLAEDIQDELEALPGVLDVALTGGRDREIQIFLDPARMEFYGLSYAQVIQRIQEEHVNIPAGYLNIHESKYLVRLQGEYKDIYEMADIILATPGGNPVKIRDIARVVDGFKDIDSVARFNGEESITLRIKKRPGENVVKIVQSIRDHMSTRSLPKGVTYSIVQDQSKTIKEVVSDLESTVLTGVILVLLVLFFALGLRNAFFCAVAIPLSMLVTFIVLDFMGITLNMVVLAGLILAVGMLVDNSIVVVESIFRHSSEGKTPLQAAYDGTKEVGWSVISSTLTTVAAFFPMIFWPGVMGKFVHYLPLTVVITLLSSMFVALIINPVIAGSLIKSGKKIFDESGEARSTFMRIYQGTLKTALHHPIITMILAFVVFVFSALLFAKFNAGYEFFPETPPEKAQLSLRGSIGTRVEVTDERIKFVENLLLNEHDIKTVNAASGYGSGMFSGASPSHRGTIDVEFVDKKDQNESPFAVMERIRAIIDELPGAKYSFKAQSNGPSTQSPIQIRLSGDDYNKLEELSVIVQERIGQIPGVINVADNFDPASPEIHLKVNREKAKERGVSTYVIGMAVRTAVNGYEASTLRDGDKEYSITVRYEENYRQNLEDLLDVRLPSTLGGQVPLRDVTDVVMTGGYGSIMHYDRLRTITVSADVTAERSAAEALSDIYVAMDKDIKPLFVDDMAGYRITYGGQTEQQEEAMQFLVRAVIAAILLILLILITQFKSFLRPFIIATTVLMSFVGVLLGLVITQDKIGVMMTGMGGLALAGVVVNNGIVLIDYTGQLRDEGLDLEPALIRAAIVRFRPVLLTAITTILGMLPMSLGLSIRFGAITTGDWSNIITEGGASSSSWIPLARTIIYGLCAATVMTMILVPVMYLLMEKFFKLIGIKDRRSELQVPHA